MDTYVCMGACVCLENLQASFHRTRCMWTILKVTARKEGKVGYTNRKGQDSLSSSGSCIVNNIQARSERPHFHFLLIYWKKEMKRKERKDKGCWCLEIIVLKGLIAEQCSYWGEPNADSHSTSSWGLGAAPWTRLGSISTRLSHFLLLDFGWFPLQTWGFLDFATTEVTVRLHKSASAFFPSFFLFFSFPYFLTTQVNSSYRYWITPILHKKMAPKHSSPHRPGPHRPQVFHLLSKSCEPGTKFTLWITTFLQDP